jgi:hypothetical protein
MENGCKSELGQKNEDKITSEYLWHRLNRHISSLWIIIQQYSPLAMFINLILGFHH